MRLFAAAAAAVLSVLAGFAGPASANETNQHWTVITRPGEPTRVNARGVLNASGTVIDILTLNLDGTFDNLATQVFPDGNLFYHGAGTYEIAVNPLTCHGTGHVVGPFQITGGTGAYTGASGSGVALISLRFYLEKSPFGCVGPPRTYGVARAAGLLNLP